LELTSNATIYSNKLYGLGSSGNISIDANKVSLEDGSIIRSAGFLSSGNILINAAESFKLSGVSFGNDNTYYRISSITTTGGENAGNISIISKNLDINNGAKVTTRSLSNEDSGDISLSGEKIIISGINADLYNLLSTQVNTSEADKLLLSRTNISSISEADFGNSPVPNRIFKAGDINILADNFDLRDGASIISQSLGNQELTNLNNAGNISITSESLVISNGSIIDSSSVYGGNAGDITLDAESLSISGGTSNDLGLVTGVYSSSSSPVNTNTSSPIIKISADDISLTASAVIDSHTTGNAKGGEIEITSNNFNINNSKITSTSSSIGDAGSINIHANSINSENNSEITTHSEFANGGEINLISESKIQLTDSNLTSLVKGSKGSGGDISLKSNFIIINSSDIITTAVEGDGGNISINANNLILSSDSILDASSELALNGQILINTTNDLRKDMGKLPEERQNIENFAHGNCSAHNSRVSSLIATNESHHYNYSVVGPSNYDIKLANSYTRQAEINMTSETHQSLYDPYNQVIASNINCVRQ
jgi:large exoprotein involved in heme utilization and adhesion